MIRIISARDDAMDGVWIVRLGQHDMDAVSSLTKPSPCCAYQMLGTQTADPIGTKAIHDSRMRSLLSGGLVD